MKVKLHYFVYLSLVALLLYPAAGKADPLTIGYLSFDSGVVDGENSFDLYNLTGGIDAPGPDAVADDLLFSGVLTYTTHVGTSSFSFSGVDVDGGAFTTLGSVLSSDDVLSATLSLTLSNSTGVAIYDDSGNLTTANLLSVPDTTLGGPLIACDGSGSPCSNADVIVSVAPPVSLSATPEPSSLALLATGFFGIFVLFRNRLRSS